MRVHLVMFLAVATVIAHRAEAQSIADHALAVVETSTSATGEMDRQALGNGPQSTGDVSNEGYVSGLINSTGAMYNRLVSAQGTAVTNLSASALLGTYASSYGQPVQIQYPPNYGASASASATWTDIAYVSGPLRPSELDFTFHIEGSRSFLPDLYPSLPSGASIGIGWSDQVTDLTKNYNQPGGGPIGSFFGVDFSPSATLPTGWTERDGIISGDITFIAPYDASIGGYGFTVELYAATYTYYGGGTSDFLDTLALTSVTAANGSPVAVSFDSGLTLSSVPEPSGLPMLVLGLLGAAGIARSRASRQASLSGRSRVISS
jgi:hypothetical protein